MFIFLFIQLEQGYILHYSVEFNALTREYCGFQMI